MKKHILLVASGGLDKSGVPSVIMTLVRGLKDEVRFDILLHTAAEGYFDAEFLAYGGAIYRLPKKKFRLGALKRLGELLRPIRLYFYTKSLLRHHGPYDAIHCHNDFDMAGCVAAAKAAGVPLRLCHTHKTWRADGEMGVLTRCYRRLCRRMINKNATARTGCSPDANASLYGEEAKTQVVWNSYDETRFRFAPDGGEAALPLAIAQVGYFCDNKNQLFTLEVFRRLHERLPEARLTFLGQDSGAYGEAVHEKRKAWYLEEAVRFAPPDGDIPALLRQSSLLLLPSKAEGFGIVLVEAQAMGLACYASDTVPRETDCGGVVYLPLAAGADAWADTILREGRYRAKKACDCARYETRAFLETIRELYAL